MSDEDDVVHLTMRRDAGGEAFGGGGQDIVIGREGADTVNDYFVGDIKRIADDGEDIDDVFYGGPDDGSLLGFLRVFFLRQDLPDARDEYHYSALENPDAVYPAGPDTEGEPTLAAKGLSLNDVSVETIHGVEFVQLSVSDLNTEGGAVFRDLLRDVELVVPSERRDEAQVSDGWFATPQVIDFNGFATGEVTKADFDFLSFANLTTGIDMVNGAMRPNDNTPEVYRPSTVRSIVQIMNAARLRAFCRASRR